MSEKINSSNNESPINKPKSENIEKISEAEISSEYLTDLNEKMIIEDKIIEELSQTQDNNLKQSLSNLRQAGEVSLKKLSAKTIDLFNSNKLVIKLRDIYIERRSEKIIKELKNNKNLAKIEDFDNFFKLLKSDFWGGSSSSKITVYQANEALTKIANTFPEDNNHEKIINIWASLFNKTIVPYNDSFTDYVSNIKNSKLKNIAEEEEKIEIMKSSNEFVALDFASSQYNLKKEDSINLFDSIMLKYPDLKSLPTKYLNSLFNLARQNPEEIISDSSRTNFIFKLWLSAFNKQNANLYYYNQNDLRLIIPLLTQRLKYCSSEESKVIVNGLIHNFRSQDDDFQWLLKIIPLEKEHYKIINNYLKNNQEDDLLLSIKDESLNQNTKEKELALLMEKSNQAYNGPRHVFLSNIIASYSNNKLGITEEDLSPIIDNLFKQGSNRMNLEDLHPLNELANRYNWSENLIIKLVKSSNLDQYQLNKLFTNSDTQDHQWIKKNPTLMQQLELDFHQQADENNLRHYFYNVLDNKYTSSNLDDLIKSYAQKGNYFDFEEINNLFKNNRINRKYIAYFINKVSIENLLQGVNNLTNQEDKNWYLESAIKYGKVNGLTDVLVELLTSDNADDPEKKSQILESFSQNIISKIDAIDVNKDNDKLYEVSEIAKQIFSGKLLNLLSEEEASLFSKKILNSALDFKYSGSTTAFILKDEENIKKFFPNDQERKEYLEKLLNRLINDKDNEKYYQVLSFYFNNKELLSIIDENLRFDLENKIFSQDNILNYSPHLLRLFYYFNEQQKNSFLNNFENFYKIDRENQRQICKVLNDYAGIISLHNQAALKRIYINILQDPQLEYEGANILFEENIILNNKDIRDVYFSNIIRWPGIDGTTILSAMAIRKRNEKQGIFKEEFPLTTEEVKLISTATMKNRGLSPKFWNNYLESDKNDPTFYLDQELFKIGIDNIGSDFLKNKAEDMVNCLQSITNSEFEFSEEDRQKIIAKIFQHYSFNFTYQLEVFYNYDPVIMESLIVDNIDKYYYSAVKSKINYSQNINQLFIDYVIKNQSEISNQKLDELINYLKKNNNQEIITQLKNNIEQLNDQQINQSKVILLKHDLLTVEECKQLYQSTTTLSKDNVRSQILNYIDIISSMLSNQENINKLELFLDNPQRETIRDLQEISQFIFKYQKENKGRSIVVMLFAKEYLPDRKLEVVIERVASNLRKYQEIINKFSYKNIPEGIKSSIGMEYEITSSTAKAYQELTSQASLKEDIARLSQAARIGSGKDAVHEIATTPTDNPYLMLLEMKLLHDIEYIDLNFDRSENYQKGARGFHLTIGGEYGLEVNQETNLLQNTIIGASWAGVQAGETGHQVNGGRGVSLRGRDAGSANNVAFFDEKTNSVEFRSLSIDTQETLQRAVVTAFHGAIAIQAFKKCFTNNSVNIAEMNNQDLLKNTKVENNQIIQIALLWINLVREIKQAINNHNKSFLESETIGYLDNQEIWIETADFKGEENKTRFEAVVNDIDPTLSIEEYVNSTKIEEDEFFKSFDLKLSDKLTKINNLFLKSGVKAKNKKGERINILKGDNINAIAMLENTKLGNDKQEGYDKDFLKKTIFDLVGEKRLGYYNIQGASEKMITHGIQKALLNFNQEMEKLLN